MHHLIQRGKVRSQVINVPEGLPELLSDITREALRCQPTKECLCQFIIDYLYSVIVTRDKARIAKSIIDRALHVVDNVIADMCICDIPKAKVDHMCEAMEECFRRFLAQRRCERGKDKEIIKFNELDMLDELVKKCKFTKDELKTSRPVIEAAYQKFVDAYMTAKDSSEGTDSLYQYLREREIKRMEERLRADAAVKIQSNFRGFLVRKSILMDNLMDKPSIPSETEHDIMQQEMAARKIQQYFRSHISIVKNIDEEDQLQNPGSSASLTAPPFGHQVVQQEKPYEEKSNDEIKEQIETINIEDKQSININQEDAVEAEPINDNITKD